ncbi:YkuS family protein [Clostridium sp.]|jgi:galactitol-specific phosphotransferase system IIB component|uniref:YkuS family protein n=1 Tax=Clostridium sp. TaxID=1506 RepID=UPI0039F4D3D6
MKKIAVERELSNIGDFLKNAGYSVQELDTNMKYNSSELDKFDAVVLSGLSEDVMGFQDTLTSTSIINAEGMTREQIKEEIDKMTTRR